MSTHSMTLTSLAMLKVNADRVNRDYIDYLLPFVQEVLSQDNSPTISDRPIQQAILTQFGLKIPTAGVQFVLRRLAKRGYLKRDHGVFTKAKDLPESDIAGRQATATRQITQVVTHLGPSQAKSDWLVSILA